MFINPRAGVLNQMSKRFSQIFREALPWGSLYQDSQSPNTITCCTPLTSYISKDISNRVVPPQCTTQHFSNAFASSFQRESLKRVDLSSLTLLKVISLTEKATEEMERMEMRRMTFCWPINLNVQICSWNWSGTAVELVFQCKEGL